MISLNVVTDVYNAESGFKASGRSLVKIEHSEGPRHLPLSTPQMIGFN